MMLVDGIGMVWGSIRKEDEQISGPQPHVWVNTLARATARTLSMMHPHELKMFLKTMVILKSVKNLKR